MDRGWPDDMTGVAVGDKNAERDAQTRQRRQRYIDYTLQGLSSRYRQREAQNSLMEHLNATWNDFLTHFINKDVTYQISASFLIDEEQNNAQMASLGQELKNLRTELREHRVDAVEGNRKPIDPNHKEDRMLQGFLDIVEPMDILPVSAERRYQTRKSRSYKMTPQPRKKLRSPKTTAKDVDPPTDVGIGLVGTEMWKPDDH